MVREESWDEGAGEEDQALVTIGQYASPVQAALDKSVLASRGIEAHVLGEHSASTIGPIVGGLSPVDVELKVDARDAEAARAILAEQPDTESDALEREALKAPRPEMSGLDEEDRPSERCPACGSEMIEMGSFTGVQKLIGFLGLGLPMFFFKPSRSCRGCGHTWRP